MFHVKHRRLIDFDLEQWSFCGNPHPSWVAIATQGGLLKYLAAGNARSDGHPERRQTVRVPATIRCRGLTHDELAADPEQPR